jgi:hypothetical protein
MQLIYFSKLEFPHLNYAVCTALIQASYTWDLGPFELVIICIVSKNYDMMILYRNLIRYHDIYLRSKRKVKYIGNISQTSRNEFRFLTLLSYGRKMLDIVWLVNTLCYNRPAKVWCIKWGRSHYLWFFSVWRELTINMSSTKSLAGTKGLLQRDCCECFVYENLETKTAFRALLLSCATHINRHVSR